MPIQADLHYVYDPFCGWCYGVAPLLTAASQLEELRIVPHGGGLLAGDRAKMMSKEWRDFVRPHERRITVLSGQTFGQAYTEQTQFDFNVVLDSGPPTAAMLTAEDIAGMGLAMLKRLQVAYYVEGRQIADRAELLRLAAELGLPGDEFSAVLDGASSMLAKHFQESAALLDRIGANGYPAFALEVDGALEPFHMGRILGKPAVFKSLIEARLGIASSAAS